MKPTLLLLALAAVLSCTSQKTPAAPMDEPVPVAVTKTSIVFEQSIWEHRTGDAYNTYLYFHGDTVSLFYGRFGDELERWSDFYDSDYAYDEGTIRTSLSYPDYGSRRDISGISVIKTLDVFSLMDNGGNGYERIGTSTEHRSAIAEQWIPITATITPWK